MTLTLRRIILVWVVMIAGPAAAATVPAGFSESLVAEGLNRPTAMAFAPDGRLFICEQDGQLRVVSDGVLQSQPFVTLTVNSSGERGLIGVAFDPAFEINHFVYVYYTATTPVIHNRVSRFTANGDEAVPGSEQVILELDQVTSDAIHNGGAIHFGPDGKLYVAVGDHGNPDNAQSLSTRFGKLLRINRNGTIPLDNPFANGRRRQPGHLGARLAQSLYVLHSTGHREDVHQRRRRENMGGDQRGGCGRKLRVARDRGTDRRSALRSPAPRVRPWGRLRDNRWRVLQPGERPVPVRVPRVVLLCGFLLRMDTPARSRDGTIDGLRHRDLGASGPEGRGRWEPLLSGTRRRRRPSRGVRGSAR